ncbi:MAG: hypothetical protein ACKONH_09955 [Planctomycetia bacterium]
MSRSCFPRSLAVVCLVLVAILLPAAGCGGGKKKTKKTMTIGEREALAAKAPSPEAKAREYVEVVRLKIRSGDKEGAKSTLGKANDCMPEEALATVWGPRLVEIAELYAQIYRRAEARKAVGQAVDMSERIDDAISRIRLLAEAGGLYGAKSGGLGESKLARDVLGRAVELSGGVEDRFKAQALSAIAMGYAQAGLAKDAGKVVEDLEASAKGLEDPRPQAEALAAAASVRSQTGDKDAAVGLLKEAAEAAKSIGEKGIAAENRTYALLAVATAYANAGDAKAAGSLLKLAEKSAMQVPDPEAQKNAVEKVRQAQTAVERKK